MMPVEGAGGALQKEGSFLPSDGVLPVLSLPPFYRRATAGVLRWRPVVHTFPWCFWLPLGQ